MIIEVLLNQQVEHVSSFSSKVVHAPKDIYSLDFFLSFYSIMAIFLIHWDTSLYFHSNCLHLQQGKSWK